MMAFVCWGWWFSTDHLSVVGFEHFEASHSGSAALVTFNKARAGPWIPQTFGGAFEFNLVKHINRSGTEDFAIILETAKQPGVLPEN